MQVLYHEWISKNQSRQDLLEPKFQEKEIPFHQDDVIDIVIDYPAMQIKLSTHGNAKFKSVSKLFCELTGLKQSEIRFMLDGNRLHDNLTLFENEIQDHSALEAFQEMLGGKGPDEHEAKIRQMLDNCDSDTQDDSEDDESPAHENDYRWYEELKLKLKQGTLLLNKSNHQDQKLLYLLETDHLQPYEILKLRNVYSCWEQTLKWKEGSKKDIEAEQESLGKSKTKRNTKAPVEPSNRETRQKRSIQELSRDLKSNDEVTPVKRRKLLDTVGLTTPSPLIKNSHIDELEMKRISVGVHLWAERKMGGVKFLQNTRLEDCHFNDILQFTGPGSKWKLMKDRTLAQLRSLWRNTFGGKHHYRGHKNSGFENGNKRHEPSVQFCPFDHCTSGLMSQMDLDLVVLTPNKMVVNEGHKPNSSRKLFKDMSGQENMGIEDEAMDVEERSSNLETVLLETSDKPLESLSDIMTTTTDDTPEMDASRSESVEGEGNLAKKEMDSDIVGEDEQFKKETELLFVCNVESCGKTFQTYSGFGRHKAVKHPQLNVDKEESTCQICSKKVIYVEQHMRAKHSDVQKPMKCEVCLLDINTNMQKHRKSCNKCLHCDYTNPKKARLLNHIEKCLLRFTEPVHRLNEEPLDLRSPMKLVVSESHKHETDKQGTDKHESVEHETDKHEAANQETADNKDIQIVDNPRKKENVKLTKKVKAMVEKETFEKGRMMYPFDDQSTDEDYYSEIDVDDTDLFTVERRKNKDDVELQLREIDGLKNFEVEGDNMIVEKFKEFLRNKKSKDSKGGYAKQTETSTINQYGDVVRNDILKAIHKLVLPFDARWLIDCKTPKECTFEGEERLHVKPEEPIYLTSRILQEALQRHEDSGNSGNQKKKVIASFCQLMDFVELHFTLKLNAYGVKVLSKVQTYHMGVKSFIKGTSQWKKNNDEEKESYENNKLMNNYDSPNKDVDVLEKYKEYIKGEERILKISKLLSYAIPEADAPTNALMTEFGTIVMEEIVACTGCRPKVPRHLTMGPFVDAKPGFNPYDVDKEDKTLEEEVNGDKIWRRVDPNLPPREKACIHQLRNRSAVCSENCENQCVPEGYNIWITWDKTQSTKGPYYLHIPTPIKKLMDRYDIIRTNFFKGKKPKFGGEDHWLDAAETPLFLNSACNSFSSLDLKKLSSDLGIDVTAYSFRKIVSTWALTHRSAEIRSAEEEALQHSLHVAKDRYLQSKQVQPQTLTQTYTREENLFPESFRKELQKDQSDIDAVIAKKQDERAKMRISQLFKRKGLSKKLKYENRPLGPRKAILESDRNEFIQFFEESTRSDFETLLTTSKPIQFRDLLVRVVFSSSGEVGENLRRLWVKMYKGDLLHGIRDLRCQAKELNWPLRKQNPGRKDRNSWIAHNLRRSCQAAEKFNE